MGFRKPIEILRKSPGAYQDGEWIDGAEVVHTTTASVQPVTGKQLQALPENRRTGGVFALFSSFQFQAGGTPGAQPDAVILGGKRYECFQVEPWGNDVINHNKGLFYAVY